MRAEMRELIAGELKRTNGDNTKMHGLPRDQERCLVQTSIPDSRTLIVDTGVKDYCGDAYQEAMDFVSARAPCKVRKKSLQLPDPSSFSGND